MGEVRVFATDLQLLTDVADRFEALLAALPHDSRLRVAFTGGTLGIALLAELGRRGVRVEHLDVFFGDERWVPGDDPERNEHQALTAWPELKGARLYRFSEPATTSLANAAVEMNSKFAGMVSAQGVTFDLVLLGVGPDGHVASLFPGHTAGQNQWVVWEDESPKPPAQRISFSYEALNGAERVWFIASGAAKAAVVTRAIHQGPDSDLPCGKVNGIGETVWFIDEAIAAEL